MKRKQIKNDLRGKTFGRLVVVSLDWRRTTLRHNYWRCRCSCGKRTSVCHSNLLTGGARSCGCLRKEATASKNKTHGDTYTSLYSLWSGIIKRCEDRNQKSYKDYGGRGIRMYPRWRKNFTAFRDYVNDSLGVRPEGYSLDRIDNDGDYRPGNIRWADRATQSRNRRKTMLTLEANRKESAR